MKVILKERVRSLGVIGEVVNVSSGYARNYLLPNNLAVAANEKNEKAILDAQNRLAKKIAEQNKEYNNLKRKLDGLKVEVVRKVSSSGKLFGHVGQLDITKLLNELGHNVERRMIQLDQPVKTLGEFSIKVKVLPEVSANLTLSVKKEEEEEKKTA